MSSKFRTTRYRRKKPRGSRRRGFSSTPTSIAWNRKSRAARSRSRRSKRQRNRPAICRLQGQKRQSQKKDVGTRPRQSEVETQGRAAMRDDPVIVAGGGIGGLATAPSLAQKQFRGIVLERAAHYQEIGAGIQIGPKTLPALH